jgi:hypothetical protein
MRCTDWKIKKKQTTKIIFFPIFQLTPKQQQTVNLKKMEDDLYIIEIKASRVKREKTNHL